MATSDSVITYDAGEISPIRRGLWGDAFRRLIKNRFALAGLAVVGALIVVAIFAPLVARYEPTAQDYKHTIEGPSSEHWFGTDKLGRDLYARIVYGTRISLSVGIFTQTVAVLVGMLVGCAAGLGGHRIDNLMMRFTDIAYAFPDLLLIILIVNAFGTSYLTIFLAIALVSWSTIARLVRGQMLALKEREYVLAARALGASPVRVVFRHMLPNTLGPVIVVAAFGIPSAIFAEAVLSFIGLGLQPPTPSWGTLILDGYRAIHNEPALAFFPALTIALLMMSFTFIGDGLRDALDPRAH